MLSKSICKHDCFHCPFADCVEDSRHVSKWEAEVMKGAHYAWESEAIASIATRMRESGYNVQTICDRMGITRKVYENAIARRKRAARLLAQSSGNKKTT